MPVFQYRSRVNAPAEEVFAWHTHPGTRERLSPPWLPLRMVEQRGGIQDGGQVILEIRWGWRRSRWVVLHTNFETGRRFSEVLLEGPFRRWTHTHLFIPKGPSACDMEDHIDYQLRLGGLGELLQGRSVHGVLQRVFEHRHRVLRDDLSRHRTFRRYGPQRVVMSGACGLIGSGLSALLHSGGHRIDRLVRRPPRPDSMEIQWSPAQGELDSAHLEGMDAVINLSGSSIGAGRWSAARKREIFESRVFSTRLLSEAIAGTVKRPRVLIASSAIGYYGHRGNDLLVEESEPGVGFLAEVCRAWEAATQPARDAGVRVVNLRTGLVLSAKGGSLPSLLSPHKLGLGGKIGDGRQYISWIALDDLIGSIHHLLFTEGIEGPVNAVAPEPVTNAEFSGILGQLLKRPTLLPLPAFVVRALLGEMGQTLLLEGARVSSARLEQSGFRFLSPDLERALAAELGRVHA